MKPLLTLLLIIASINLFGQKEYYVTSNDGTKLFVREFGAGKPLVMLAGGPGLNVDYLQPVWQHLQNNYRCIVLDQRGTGKSLLPKIDSITMSMENYINDLEAVRKHLGEEQLTLVGHSWGGMYAMEYTAYQPERAGKLILLSPGGPSGTFYTWFGDNIRMRLHDSDRKELAMLDSLRKPSLSGLWPGYFYDRSAAMKAKAVADFDHMFGQPGINPNTLGGYFKQDTERVILLKKYKGPVFLIQGRQDPVGESTFFEIKDALPQTQLHIIEKCGHLPWLEKEDKQAEFYKILDMVLQQ